MIQHRFHYAITGQTAAEIVYSSADHKGYWPLPKYRQLLFVS